MPAGNQEKTEGLRTVQPLHQQQFSQSTHRPAGRRENPQQGSRILRPGSGQEMAARTHHRHSGHQRLFPPRLRKTGTRSQTGHAAAETGPDSAQPLRRHTRGHGLRPLLRHRHGSAGGPADGHQCDRLGHQRRQYQKNPSEYRLAEKRILAPHGKPPGQSTARPAPIQQRRHSDQQIRSAQTTSRHRYRNFSRPAGQPAAAGKSDRAEPGQSGALDLWLSGTNPPTGRPGNPPGHDHTLLQKRPAADPSGTPAERTAPTGL